MTAPGALCRSFLLASAAFACGTVQLVAGREVRQEAGGAGAVTGCLRNGTAGWTRVTGAAVAVVPLREASAASVATATVDADGCFSVAGLATMPDTAYGVVATYGGVDYVYARAVTLTATSPVRSGVDLTVYETTERGRIYVSSALMMLEALSEQGTLAARDVWVVRNDGDRTWVAASPASAIRWPLPQDASDVHVEGAPVGYAPRLEGGVLVDTAPVPPGERRVSVTYTVPYQGSAYDLRVRPPLDVERFVVVVSSLQDDAGNAKVAGARLPDVGVDEIGGRAVVGAGGGPFAAGDAIEARVSGLPPIALAVKSPADTDVRPLAGLLVGVALGGIVVALDRCRVLVRRNGRRRQAAHAGRVVDVDTDEPR